MLKNHVKLLHRKRIYLKGIFISLEGLQTFRAVARKPRCEGFGGGVVRQRSYLLTCISPMSRVSSDGTTEQVFSYDKLDLVCEDRVGVDTMDGGMWRVIPLIEDACSCG